MQLIGLEEHFVTPDVLGAWLALPREQRDLAVNASDQGEVQQRLHESGLSESEQEQIASGNWNRLCAGIRRDRGSVKR